MASRILVVEDEILVAMELEAVAQDLGHVVVGIAPDTAAAFKLAAEADIAFVDVNLRNGETGPAIGLRLAQEFGLTVVFLTANPSRLGLDVPGVLGVVSKPVTEAMTAEIIDFAERRRAQQPVEQPPRQITLFPRKQA
ncbi:response regulator [soil metagenome]